MRKCEKPVGLCYTGQYQRPRRYQREKVLLIHYDVVSSSRTLNMVKLHQTAHRHRVQHPERRFDSDSDPTQTDFWTPFFLFWKAAEHSKPGSRGQNFKHAIILLLVSSQNLDHLVVGGCESYISNPFCHSGGGQAKQYPPLLIGSSYVFLLIKRSVGRDMDNWISWLGYPYVHE